MTPGEISGLGVHGSRLEVMFPYYERYEKSISYYGPRIWNELPPECKVNHMPNSFKKNLKQHFWTIFQEWGFVTPNV